MTNDFVEIRDAVARLCADFPGRYWRDKDRARAYPQEFVEALSAAGYLAVLIPEEYGGSGLGIRAAAAVLEEIHKSGCNGAACHAQMYTMGTLLKHGSDAQKREYLPRIAAGTLRLQAFGVTEPTSGTDTTRIRTTAVRDGDVYRVNGQKVFISRTEHSDLMLLLVRTTARDAVAKPTDGISVLLVDMHSALGAGLTIKPLATMMNHATTELFFDNVEVPVANLVGTEGKGFGYILDSMNAERILIASECIGDARWFIAKAAAYATERQVFGRRIGENQGSSVPDRARPRADGGRRAHGAASGGAVRCWREVRRRGQYGQDARGRRLEGGCRRLHPDPRRLRFRRGIRHRAQVPRDAALSGRAGVDEPDSVVRRHARARDAEVFLIHVRRNARHG